MSTLKVTNIAPQSGNNVYLTGSLTISETLIAKEVRTELTQSVTLFQSGSTQFGDTADDTHIFTGDVTVTGAVGITGFTNLSSSLAALTGSFSSSVETRLSTEENNVDALQADSASFSTRVTTNETDIAALTGSFSSSVETRLTVAESELGNTLLSSSAQIADDISGSFVAASSSIATDIDALQTDSGSFSTRVTDLESFSSSLDATYATDAQLATATASLSSSLATDIAANTADIVTLTGATSSYAFTTGSIFTGKQELTGSIDVSGSISIKPTGDELTNRLSFDSFEFHAKSPGFYWMTDSITIGSNDESTLFTQLNSTRLEVRTLLTLTPVSTKPSDLTAGTFAVSGSTPIYCDGVNWYPINLGTALP